MINDDPSAEEMSRVNEALAPVRDPGPEVVAKILDGLEQFSDPPVEVARKARRLRAHIDALNDRIEELEGEAEDARVERDLAS